MVVEHIDQHQLDTRVIELKYLRASPRQRRGKWYWRENGEWHGPFDYKSAAIEDAKHQ